jgi:branched-chain amino acid transport system substrate-binding protein
VSLLARHAIFRLGSGVLALGLMGAAAGFALPVAASAASSSAPGVTKTSITVGDVASLTGIYGAEFAERAQAFNAAIDAQNAKGGVDGRKIKVVTEDDQSTPAGDLTAVQSLVEAKGVFMLAENSPIANGGANYLETNDIPVVQTGNVPSLGSYPNYFFAPGGVNTNTAEQVTTLGLIMKKIGATKVGAFANATAPGGIQSAIGAVESAKKVGLQAGYLNTTVSPTTTDWTPYALGLKSSRTNGIVPEMTVAEDLGVLTTAKQQGWTVKALFGSGYDFDVLAAPATEPLMQGVYVSATFAPSELNTPGTIAENAAMKKYGHFTNPADFVSSSGYAVGLLVIRGLEAAGPNPTRAGLIKNLRAVKNYTADGLLPVPVNFAKALKPAFQPPNSFAYGNCQWVLKVEGKKFVPLSSTPICGKLFTAAASS